MIKTVRYCRVRRGGEDNTWLSFSYHPSTRLPTLVVLCGLLGGHPTCPSSRGRLRDGFGLKAVRPGPIGVGLCQDFLVIPHGCDDRRLIRDVRPGDPALTLRGRPIGLSPTLLVTVIDVAFGVLGIVEVHLGLVALGGIPRCRCRRHGDRAGALLPERVEHHHVLSSRMDARTAHRPRHIRHVAVLTALM